MRGPRQIGRRVHGPVELTIYVERRTGDAARASGERGSRGERHHSSDEEHSKTGTFQHRVTSLRASRYITLGLALTQARTQ